MTEPCSCTMPGFCTRHGLKKSEVQWRLCQTKENYRAAWDRGILHGQNSKDEEKEERMARIRKMRDESDRLFSWVWLFRKAGDRGAGDTALRLFHQCKNRHADLKRTLKAELKVCDCKLKTASETLNSWRPYCQSCGVRIQRNEELCSTCKEHLCSG